MRSYRISEPYIWSLTSLFPSSLCTIFEHWRSTMSQSSPCAAERRTVFITSTATRRFHNDTLQLSPNGRYVKLEEQINSAEQRLEKVIRPKLSLCGYHVSKNFPRSKVSNENPDTPIASKMKTGLCRYDIAGRDKSFILSKIFKSSKDNVATGTKFSKDDIAPETNASVSSSETLKRSGIWRRLISMLQKSIRCRSNISHENQSSSSIFVSPSDCSSVSPEDEILQSSVHILWTRDDQDDKVNICKGEELQNNDLDKIEKDSVTVKRKGAVKNLGWLYMTKTATLIFPRTTLWTIFWLSTRQ